MIFQRSLLGLALCAGLWGAAATQEGADTVAPKTLLDHLAGNWVMKGSIGGKQVVHDVAADWVLNREYLRLHEISREHDVAGRPVYEAIVFISWDSTPQRYTCLWLDSTSGGGLSAEGLAHAKRAQDAMPFIFNLSGNTSLHTTFRYDDSRGTWRLLIDDVSNGKVDHFADVELSRRPLN